MVQRSGLVSLALIMIPNIIVIAFRTLSPELDEALANDDLGEILIYLWKNTLKKRDINLKMI